MITSFSNHKLKMIRELMNRSRIRDKAGAFVIEGIRMFNEAPEDLLEEVYISESFREKHPGIAGETVAEAVFKKLSDTSTPQGIMAVVKKPEYDRDALMDSNEGLYLVLERIQDPGNLGTMVRTGEAAGLSCLIMDRETTDIYSPKVVRSTMGAIFRVPCIYTDDLKSCIENMKSKNIGIFAADLLGTVSYDKAEYGKNAAFLIGNEGNGLRPETAALSDVRLRIPMKGKVESLNAAVAASLLMYGFMMKGHN